MSTTQSEVSIPTSNQNLGCSTRDSSPNSILNTVEGDIPNDASTDDAMTEVDFNEVDSQESEPVNREATMVADRLCKGSPGCVAQSSDHRKVVSHVFGRNKKCTLQLPDDSWVKFCRKHYQRTKYRFESNNTWHLYQLELVRQQLDAFERFASVKSWNIFLLKPKSDAIEEEDRKNVAHQKSIASAIRVDDSDGERSCSPEPTSVPSAIWERFLLPYVGENKSYADIRRVLKAIDAEFMSPDFQARDEKNKVFPAIEFLPNIARGAKKTPLTKRGPRPIKAKSDSVSSAGAVATGAEVAPVVTQSEQNPASRKRKASQIESPKVETKVTRTMAQLLSPSKRPRRPRTKALFTDLYN